MADSIERAPRERRHFDEIAAQYDSLWYHNEIAIRNTRKRLAFLRDSLILEPGTYVLEIGCGTGQYTQPLLLDGVTIYGIDISPAMLKVATHRCGESGQVAFVAPDALRIPFPDQVFDAVFGAFVLHHVCIPSALDEIVRVSKRGARMAFCQPNLLNPVVYLIKNVSWIKQMLGDSDDETALSPGYVRYVLSQAGFSCIQVQPIEFLHPLIPKWSLPVMQPLAEMMERVPGVRNLGGSLLTSARVS